jgi:hypothetical protein
LAHFNFSWYILSGFGIMYQDKSGNPDAYVHVGRKRIKIILIRVYTNNKKNESGFFEKMDGQFGMFLSFLTDGKPVFAVRVNQAKMRIDFG